MHWSHSEKAVARKAFQLALHREFDKVIAEVKKRAAALKEPTQIWDLEDYLTAQRKRIDRQYDYRYSMLIMVFGDLISNRRLTEKELEGLSEDKLEHIRRLSEPIR